MKILMVNKFYYIKGGSETYYFALKKMLEKEGHAVIDFFFFFEKNFDSPYSEYFVENVDYNSSSGIFNKMKIAKNIIMTGSTIAESIVSLFSIICSYMADILLNASPSVPEYSPAKTSP